MIPTPSDSSAISSLQLDLLINHRKAERSPSFTQPHLKEKKNVCLESKITKRIPRGHRGKSLTHTHTHTHAHLKLGKRSEAGLDHRSLTSIRTRMTESLYYPYLKPIHQAYVSTELISETNKENEVCEERGFAPPCLESGHPVEWAPHSQRVGAPSGTLTFPAPPAPVQRR